MTARTLTGAEILAEMLDLIDRLDTTPTFTPNPFPVGTLVTVTGDDTYRAGQTGRVVPHPGERPLPRGDAYGWTVPVMFDDDDNDGLPFWFAPEELVATT